MHTESMVVDAVNWQGVHQRLTDLAAAQAALDEEQGRLLLTALRAGVHAKLGFGSFVEYVERLFGCGPRETGERLRVARALEELPATAAKLGDGELNWSAVRELTRVAVPKTEQAWLAAAVGKTVRQIERMVSGREHGDLPSDPPTPGAKRHVLRFEVSAETYATWCEAVTALRHEAGGMIDEDTALLMMARRVLGGPDEPGRSNYQVAITVCESCGQGFQEARGEDVPIGDEILEMALCDAQHIGHVGAPAGEQASNTHVGKKRTRASQSIPPAVRREVMRRDRGRCVVPGCRNRRFTDNHHITTKEEGGEHDPDLIVTICAGHHRPVHRGLLIIEGRVSTGLRFYHADGSPYGVTPPDPQAVETAQRAFSALRNLGFKDGEVKRALAEVRAHVDTGIEELIRAALGVLTA
jgi:hypothetical protein